MRFRDEVEFGTAVANVIASRLSGTQLTLQPKSEEDEKDLFGAVFAGYPGAMDEMKRTPVRDFSDPFWLDVRTTAEAFIQAGKPERVRIAWLASLMERAGIGIALDHVDRMVQAQEESPCVPKRSAQRIREAARVRRLSNFLRQLDRDLCLDVKSADEAIEAMQRAVSRTPRRVA